MLTYPQFDPVALQLGPVAIRWYGLMYLFGFISGWLLGRYRAKQPHSPYTPHQVDDLVTYLVIGLVLGGRLGYILFYDFSYYLADPLRMLAVWQGGMAFHGGLLGVIVAGWLFSRRHNRTLFQTMDFVAPLIPPGLFAGRIGNFINAELWGRPTDLPWAMVFPDSTSGFVPRHPSQLYEAFLEGIVLFICIWIYSGRRPPAGSVSGLFLLLYGIFRFSVELVRQPDVQLGYLAWGWVTMGQLLCLPMILGGVFLLALAHKHR